MVDRDNETWVAELRGLRGKQRQEDAFQDLGAILLPHVCWYLGHCATHFDDYGNLDQLAQDIVQDCLLRIWQRGLALYRYEAKFRTFAIAIAINQARQTLRQAGRRREQLTPSFEGEDEDEESERSLSITLCAKTVLEERSPEKQTALQEVLEKIDDILTRQCSPREREAFVRKYRDGCTSEEIARLMKTTIRAVDLLTFSVRHKLRSGLEQAGYTLNVCLEILE